jgi:hypothetical protein
MGKSDLIPLPEGEDSSDSAQVITEVKHCRIQWNLTSKPNFPRDQGVPMVST